MGQVGSRWTVTLAGLHAAAARGSSHNTSDRVTVKKLAVADGVPQIWTECGLRGKGITRFALTSAGDWT